MRNGKISAMAEKVGLSQRSYLIDQFNRHGSLTAVAEALKVDPSTVSLTVLRSGLKLKTILVPRDVVME